MTDPNPADQATWFRCADCDKALDPRVPAISFIGFSGPDGWLCEECATESDMPIGDDDAD